MSRRALFAAGLLFFLSAAHAQRPVYKYVDASGNVVYSDRKNGGGDLQVKDWGPRPGSFSYESAVQRAESDRLFYSRLLAERRQPVPVATYDPRSWEAAARTPRIRPAYEVPSRSRARWDPNLPPTPPPDLNRNYYYSGR